MQSIIYQRRKQTKPLNAMKHPSARHVNIASFTKKLLHVNRLDTSSRNKKRKRGHKVCFDRRTKLSMRWGATKKASSIPLSGMTHHHHIITVLVVKIA
mmetsp:Transcript_5670/g.12586  ORF Transcript_5670/g.12586 Transcript_5670/m.12586 type:complete len:98 (+) Transcript_5670:205-498(+)